MGKSYKMNETSSERPVITILSASYGRGYLSSARALADTLQAIARCDVDVVDYFERFMTKPAAAASVRAYQTSVLSKASGAGDENRQKAPLFSPGLFIRKAFERPGRSHLADYLARRRPDVVVSNFPTPAESVASLAHDGALDAAVVTLITEFALVPGWIHPETDVFAVPSGSIKQQLEDTGIESDKIVVSGIPLIVPPSRMAPSDIRQHLGIESGEKVVFVASGALRDLWNVIGLNDVFKGIEGKFRVIYAVTEKDDIIEHLQDAVKEQHRYSAIFVQSAGRMHELLDAADLLVGGGGAVLVSEALVREVPAIAYKPEAAEEAANAKALQAEGFMGLAWDTAKLWRLVTSFLTDDSRIRRSREAARRLARPQAAETVARVVLSLSRRERGERVA
ncbi:MAG: MGDG synthase family glycosyltransferase [Candidatus Aquicultorales bacterium]